MSKQIFMVAPNNMEYDDNHYHMGIPDCEGEQVKIFSGSKAEADANAYKEILESLLCSSFAIADFESWQFNEIEEEEFFRKHNYLGEDLYEFSKFVQDLPTSESIKIKREFFDIVGLKFCKIVKLTVEN